MKFNEFAITSFPELTIDKELPWDANGFLDIYVEALEPYKEEINLIILLNDIQNIDILSSKRAGYSTSNLSLFSPSLVSENELNLFLDNPLLNSPDVYPEFISDFFAEFKDEQQRYKNIDKLYVYYFEYLKTVDSSFFIEWGGFESMLRTLFSAVRISKSGGDFESLLKGDSEVVKKISEQRNSGDFGLKTLWPEVLDIISTLDKNPLESEKEIDKIRIKFAKEIEEREPFHKNVIFGYFAGILIKERWRKMSEKNASEILNNILEG
ncbi:DUF2764 family protein [bacterium]|nr:DUF2764 family protein [bacterium]